MPRPLLLALALLLSCGPVGAPEDAPSSSESSADPTTPDLPTTTAQPTTTTTATTTIASSTGPDDDGNTLDFISHFDLTPEECDPWTQNCPVGQKCVPWAEGGGSWNATKCVDITGDGAPGEPCTAPEGGTAGIDDCAFGAICWQVDADNHGTCLPQCTGTPDAPSCPPAHTCAIFADGIPAICIRTCNPLLQDCPGGDLCIPNGDSFTCVLDASGDEGQFNDPCEFANSCDKGLICLIAALASTACDQNTSGCCQPFCKSPDAPCPNPDQLCLQWFDPMLPIPPGYEDLGICAIPE